MRGVTFATGPHRIVSKIAICCRQIFSRGSLVSSRSMEKQNEKIKTPISIDCRIYNFFYSLSFCSEYVKTIKEIYRYNCIRKHEFIKKGLGKFRQAIAFHTVLLNVSEPISRFISFKDPEEYGKIPRRRRHSGETHGRRSKYYSLRRISAGDAAKYCEHIRQ